MQSPTKFIPIQFLQGVAISVGMAFATSCFAMLSGIVSTSGLWAFPAIGISLAVVLVVAQAMGGMAKRFPSAVGIRTYTKAAFGNTASLFFVLLYLMMIVIIAGVESGIFAGIVRQVFPAADDYVVVVVLFTAVLAINALGYEFSKNAQVVMVGLMVSVILALSFHGMMNPPTASTLLAQAAERPIGGLPEAVISAFFLFVGFEWVTSAQQPSRRSANQLPRVMVVSVLLLGFVYGSAALAMILNLDFNTLGTVDSPQMLLALKLWGISGSWVMLGVSALAVLTSFNAGVLGASRLIYSLSREGYLPSILSRTTATTGAPVPAISLITALSAASAMVALELNNSYLLGGMAAVTICACYAGLLGASIKLGWQKRPEAAGAATRRTAESVALAVITLLLLSLFLQPNAGSLAVLTTAEALGVLLAALAANRWAA
jgi:APA family basic amino acid/polyamine antiporter